MKCQEVDLTCMTEANYREVIRKDFCGEKVKNFPIREVFRDEKSPDRKGEHFPMFGSFKEFFGTPYVEKKLRDGLLFYKKGFEFLKHSEAWAVIKADSSTNPPSVLYSYNGILFSERTYPNDFFADNAPYRAAGEHFQKLCEFSKNQFRNTRFENVIGIFINDCSDPTPHRIYSSYSCGIGLDEITLETLPLIRVEMEKTLAGALKELAMGKISYSDPIPTNIRYDLRRNKIILNPHSGICFGCGISAVKDISLVLYTHDWIEDSDKFCKYFLDQDMTGESLGWLRKSVNKDLEALELGGIEEIYRCWQKRNKIPLPKEYQRRERQRIGNKLN